MGHLYFTQIFRLRIFFIFLFPAFPSAYESDFRYSLFILAIFLDVLRKIHWDICKSKNFLKNILTIFIDTSTSVSSLPFFRIRIIEKFALLLTSSI